jgi:hypothetical protein
LQATSTFSKANYEDAIVDIKTPPDFTDAIIDYKQYLSFKIKTSNNLFYILKDVYSFNEINKNEFNDSKYSCAIKAYLINELNKGNKIGKLKKINLD